MHLILYNKSIVKEFDIVIFLILLYLYSGAQSFMRNWFHKKKCSKSDSTNGEKG